MGKNKEKCYFTKKCNWLGFGILSKGALKVWYLPKGAVHHKLELPKGTPQYQNNLHFN